MSETMDRKRYHRFRFYESGWSQFDGVEACTRPAWCCGCTYQHPFCNESGALIKEPKEPA